VTVLLLLALVPAAPAAPAPAHGGESRGAADDNHKAEQEIGKAVGSPFRGWIDLSIWTILVFLLLLFVLGKFAWKPMLEGLEKREQAIHGAVEEAKQAREEAQRLRDQLRAEMQGANNKIREMLDEARKEAQGLKDDMVADARKDIQAERERLTREVGLARDEALKHIWDQGVQLASLISSKTIRRQLTPEDHRHLVDEALADLRRRGDGRHTA
jgi:F-type H+-transporting ATPase subunit b